MAKITKENFKRRYMELRLGNVTLAPLIQFGNFLMLSYLVVNEVIPIYIFAPLFVLFILISFTIVGNKFRKYQQPTDLNMGYEKATQAGATVYHMMNAEKIIMDKLDIEYPKGFLERLEYMKKIGNNEL